MKYYLLKLRFSVQASSVASQLPAVSHVVQMSVVQNLYNAL